MFRRQKCFLMIEKFLFDKKKRERLALSLRYKETVIFLRRMHVLCRTRALLALA